MKNKDKRSGFTPQENLISILPSATVGIILLLAVIASALINFSPQSPFQLLVRASQSSPPKRTTSQS